MQTPSKEHKCPARAMEIALSPLPAAFYKKPTLVLARSLLGKVLVTEFEGARCSGIICETEAYHGEEDEASHCFRGKRNGGRSSRTETMFREAGHLYVYFIYGNHFCCNVVAEREGVGAGVLIRGLIPYEGLEVMLKRRNKTELRGLLNGPGKVCQALGISGRHNGTDLRRGKGIYLQQGIAVPRSQVLHTPRIGISKSKDLLWRYLFSPGVSQYTNP